MLEKPLTLHLPEVLDAIRKAKVICARCGELRWCDPHHLPSPFPLGRRRSLDAVVPLCRACHEHVQHTAAGLRWEREQLDRLYALALRWWGQVRALPQVEGSWAEVFRACVRHLAEEHSCGGL